MSSFIIWIFFDQRFNLLESSSTGYHTNIVSYLSLHGSLSNIFELHSLSGNCLGVPSTPFAEINLTTNKELPTTMDFQIQSLHVGLGIMPLPFCHLSANNNSTKKDTTQVIKSNVPITFMKRKIRLKSFSILST